MNKKIIVIASMILGILISLQFKTIYLSNDGMSIPQKGEQLQLELKKLKTEENNLKQEIDNLKENIEQYENQATESVIKKEIDEMRAIAGYSKLEGSGIEIVFNQKENNTLTYNYDLILSVVNKLNSAKAKAIEINGNRLVSKSYFNIIENDLYINESKLIEPIVIKAIGDPDLLASSVEIKYGIVWEIEKYYDYDVEVNKIDNMIIDGYNKEKSTMNNMNGGN